MLLGSVSGVWCVMLKSVSVVQCSTLLWCALLFVCLLGVKGAPTTGSALWQHCAGVCDCAHVLYCMCVSAVLSCGY